MRQVFTYSMTHTSGSISIHHNIRAGLSVICNKYLSDLSFSAVNTHRLEKKESFRWGDDGCVQYLQRSTAISDYGFASFKQMVVVLF